MVKSEEMKRIEANMASDNQLKEKVMQTQSAEEVKAVLDTDDETAERIFKEVEQRRSDMREISIDELEAVSGGDRDWVTEGCAATVEPDSWCWSDDACYEFSVCYTNPPMVKCYCGGYWYRFSKPNGYYFRCKNCGYECPSAL